VLDVELVQALLPEEVAFAVAQGEDEDAAADYDYAEQGGAACGGEFGVFFLELPVELEEGFCHEDF
jgi:hypothetical protein